MERHSIAYFLNPTLLAAKIVRHRDLLWQFIVRQIHMDIKGSYLGMLWTALTPLCMLAVYAVVFGLIFGARFHGSPNNSATDYVLGLFLGLTLYGLVADILGQSPGLIVGQPNFVKKVVFPLEILPIALTGAGIYRLVVSLLLLTIGVYVLGNGYSWSIFILPLVIIPIILLAMGIAFFISALGVFFRDITQLTGVISMVLLYSSGIFYSAQKVQELAPSVWYWLRWNPILLDIEQARRVCLWNLPVNWWDIGYAWLCGIVCCLVGYAIFARLRPAFSDVL